MLQCLIGLLALAVVFAVIWYIAQKIISYFGLPEFVSWCIGAIMGLILLVRLLPCLGISIPGVVS